MFALPGLAWGVTVMIWGLVHWKEPYPQVTDHGIAVGFFITGLIWTMGGIVFLAWPEKTNLALAYGAIGLAMLAAEGLVTAGTATHILPSPYFVYDGSFGVFNKPCAVYDSVRGYRWLPGEARITKMVQGTLVFDNRFPVNSAGYLSPRDFALARTDSLAKRVLVLGDSYTALEFLPDPWPEVAETALNEAGDGWNWEFYSFAQDGAGLENWYRIYMNEIQGKFEYDVLVIAVFGNDFDRDFAVMHHTDSAGYFQYFDGPAASQADFEENFLPDMWESAAIVPDSVTDLRLAGAEAGRIREVKPDLFFLTNLAVRLGKLRRDLARTRFIRGYYSPAEKVQACTEAGWIAHYGADRYAKIAAILDGCAEAGVPVVLAFVPDETAVRSRLAGEGNRLQAEIEFLCRRPGVHFFDGTAPFVPLSDSELSDCYLVSDPHFSQSGSNRFGEAIARTIADLPESKR